MLTFPSKSNCVFGTDEVKKTETNSKYEGYKCKRQKKTDNSK